VKPTSSNRNLLDIQVTDQQAVLEIDPAVIRSAVERVLLDAKVRVARVSVAILDNQHIHQLNRTYLQHDYATDVLSFLFESEPAFVDGEIIVSAEMALQVAEEVGGEPAAELLLYVVHGALHLVGCDDVDAPGRAEMIRRETETLAALGLAVPRQRIAPASDQPIANPLPAGDSAAQRAAAGGEQR